MELENGTLEKEYYKQIENPSIFGFQPLIFGSVCISFLCISVAMFFSPLLFFLVLGLDPNLHEFISRCMQMIVEQQETSRFLWGETSECHDISNFSIKYHLGVLFVLNHHPVTVVLNHFFGFVEVSLDQLQPCQEKWEWPARGKCLCLFDVDRTLTSRSPKSRKICFGKQQPQQV